MDGRLARGAQTRRAIMARAVDIASVEGLDGLTIGRLATELELSKSGVFALFGSKEDLQLAAIEHAEEIFTAHVIRDAMALEQGMPRLRALCVAWIEYSRNRVFPGGCFFAGATAEFDAREGRVHDAVLSGFRRWLALIARVAAEAVAAGHLPADTDVDQLAYEIDALIRAADATSVLTGDENVYRRALAGIEARIGSGELSARPAR